MFDAAEFIFIQEIPARFSLFFDIIFKFMLKDHSFFYFNIEVIMIENKYYKSWYIFNLLYL